jgi:hypothetical protein
MISLLYLTMGFSILCHLLSLPLSLNSDISERYLFSTAEVTVMLVTNGCNQHRWNVICTNSTSTEIPVVCE